MKYGEFMPYWYIKEKARSNIKAISILIIIYGIIVTFSFVKLLECKGNLLNIKAQVESYKNTLNKEMSRKEQIEKKINIIKEVEGLSLNEESYEIKFSGDNTIKLSLKEKNLRDGNIILGKIKEKNNLQVKSFTLGGKENNYNLEMELKY